MQYIIRKNTIVMNAVTRKSEIVRSDVTVVGSLRTDKMTVLFRMNGQQYTVNKTLVTKVK